MQARSSSNAQGIDVSHHNGTIDWKKVREAGKSFAFIKASQGTSYRDPTFQTNLQGARKAGILVGAYHFLDATTVAAARAEANNFASALASIGGAANMDLPPVLDYETNPGALRQAQMTEIALTFLTEIERLTGRRPVIYTGNAFAANFTSSLCSYPLWVARYSSQVPKDTPAWSKWDFWQYSSEGRVQGISGNVDLNEYAGTLAQLCAKFLQGPSRSVSTSQKDQTQTPPPAIPQWKINGRDWLIHHIGLSNSWGPEDPLDIGTLGIILSRLKSD